jgi:hypothetical protein
VWARTISDDPNSGHCGRLAALETELGEGAGISEIKDALEGDRGNGALFVVIGQAFDWLLLWKDPRLCGTVLTHMVALVDRDGASKVPRYRSGS